MSSYISKPSRPKRHKPSSGVILPYNRDTTADTVTQSDITPILSSSIPSVECQYRYEWKIHDSTLHIMCPTNIELNQLSTNKILAVDMDSTLIRTRSGRVFPIDHTDWQWWSNTVCHKLQHAHQNGYRIVVVSNQCGISNQSTGHIKQQELYQKVHDIVCSSELCHIPFIVYLAGANDQYRKPSSHMYQHFIKHYNNNIIHCTTSLFIGDAAGRVHQWDGNHTTKKDFSVSDRKFARNCKLQFMTPDEYFNDQPAAPFTWGTDSEPINHTVQTNDLTDNSFTNSNSSVSLPTPDYHTLHSAEQEIIVFVGCPSSGKTTFAAQYFIPYNYAHISQQALKTKQKCIKQCETHIQSGSSVIIDNTNPDRHTRSLYVQLARKYKISIRCIYFTCAMSTAQNLSRVREQLDHGIHIGRIAFRMYIKNLEIPSIIDQFDDIITMNFIPQFTSILHEQMFMELV